MKISVVMIACFIAAGTVCFAQAEKTPKPPPPPPPHPKVEVVKFAPPIIVRDKDMKEFYTRNESVAKIDFVTPHKVVITKKDKSEERYNLSSETEMKAFSDKYGEAPALQPPPPPPAPVKKRS